MPYKLIPKNEIYYVRLTYGEEIDSAFLDPACTMEVPKKARTLKYDGSFMLPMYKKIERPFEFENSKYYIIISINNDRAPYDAYIITAEECDGDLYTTRSLTRYPFIGNCYSSVDRVSKGLIRKRIHAEDSLFECDTLSDVFALLRDNGLIKV